MNANKVKERGQNIKQNKTKQKKKKRKQARNQGGCTGCVRTPPPPFPQAPQVRILILNIQVKECSDVWTKPKSGKSSNVFTGKLKPAAL